MILGASVMQLPAIEAARELGFDAIAAGATADPVCVSLAERFVPIDLKDTRSLIQLADEINSEKGSVSNEKNLAGVFTAGTDFSSSVAFVAEHCSLPSHSYESCLNASDKLRMRRCFKARNVPCPDFREITDETFPLLLEDARSGKINFPKVVKPCDNMGGRGCRLVRDENELKSAVKIALDSSRTRRAIFEDYMEGDEFSIDSVVFDGTLTICGFADRHIFFQPYFVETGHTMPSFVQNNVKLELIATFAKGIHSLGLTRGIAKADIKYTKNGAMIGEIAARLSGGYMSGKTFPYASDFPLTKTALKIACGIEPEELLQRRVPIAEFAGAKNGSGGKNKSENAAEKKECALDLPFDIYEIPVKKVSAERAWISVPGRIKEIIGLENLLQDKKTSKQAGVTDEASDDLKNGEENKEKRALAEEKDEDEFFSRTARFIKDVIPKVKAGDAVRFPKNNVEKCGNVISLAETKDDAVKAAETAVSKITMRLEPFNKDTDEFLFGSAEENKNQGDEAGFPPDAYDIDVDISREFKNRSKEKKRFLKAGEKLIDFVPDSLAPYLDSAFDWNHCSLRRTIEKFDKSNIFHADIEIEVLLKAILRGGIQGALYIADCSAADRETTKSES